MKACDKLVDLGRRQFLRGGATTAAAGLAAGVLPNRSVQATPAPARVDYRAVRLANLRDLKTDEPLPIAFPDSDSPGVLLKLGRPVDDGVGPDRDIVAFSTLCPHKGYPLSYVAADRTLNCPGHYSRFDCERGGYQIWGQATQNLPQFMLAVDREGNIYATGVDELIYGRISNVLRA